MTAAQQAAKDYADKAMETVDFDAPDLGIRGEITAAFESGYEAAEGSFAEWASKTGCQLSTAFTNTWLTRWGFKTTAELLALWKEQTQQITKP